MLFFMYLTFSSSFKDDKEKNSRTQIWSWEKYDFCRLRNKIKNTHKIYFYLSGSMVGYLIVLQPVNKGRLTVFLEP